MTWVWVVGYAATAIFTFRRTMYLLYKDAGGLRLDGADWTLMAVMALLLGSCGPVVMPGFLVYSGIKALNRKGITVPHGLLMSIPMQERKELKEARKRRERIEREEYIAKLERELGIGQ